MMSIHRYRRFITRIIGCDGDDVIKPFIGRRMADLSFKNGVWCGIVFGQDEMLMWFGPWGKWLNYSLKICFLTALWGRATPTC